MTNNFKSLANFLTLSLYISVGTLLNYVILAHSSSDFRCSHVPPAPEHVTHVWLNQTEFSASYEDSLDDSKSIFLSKESSRSDSDKKISKRHVSYSSGLEFIFGSKWNPFKKQDQTGSIDKNDWVPIKIKVYYDNSVYLLNKQKLELITNEVMPSVIRYFESVLSIKREFAISTFRISRRCPNKTVYYVKDIFGLVSRPFCMDRCEDFAICGEMIVPKSHLSACSYCNSTSKRCTTNEASEGIGVTDAQLLLYVSARQTPRCKKDQTIAYAAHCAQDAKTDRPVAGHANLCPDSISTDPKDLKALIATVKHELTHVLGFSVSLFAYYRDEFGQPLTERELDTGQIPIDPKTGFAKWSDKIIKKIVRTNWVTGEGKIDKEVHLIVTPTVTKEVRRHFNCSSLEGAELEDQGSDGTSMTHWEKRLFENEAMTGTHTQNSVYTRLTLAVLQDTGWYVANFSRADNLDWGKDLGCDFAKKSCKSWIDERRSKGLNIRPFCDQVKGDLLRIACTEDRLSKAVCNMKQYKNPLSPVYQNFDKLDGVSKESVAHYGGSVDLADYCPFVQEFTWQAHNVTVRGSRCDLGSNNLETEHNAALENYGLMSRCFEHERRWEQKSCNYKRHWHYYGAGCYKYSCANGIVNVTVGNYSYPCYYTGQLIQVNQIVDQWLYNGTIICPDCEKMCQPDKCLSFDKNLIDEIQNLNYELVLSTDKNTEDNVKNSINDALNLTNVKNSLDTGSMKSIVKRKFMELVFNRSYSLNEGFRYKEHLVILLARQGVTTNPLLCSGTTGQADSYYIIMTKLLPGFIIIFLVFFEPLRKFTDEC